MNEEVTLTGAPLASEELPDIADFAEEVGGAWPKMWYRATIIEGYATRKGHQFITKDAPSKDGSSRNLQLCFLVTNVKGDERTLQESYNYRVSDLTPERLAHIKELREEFKSVQGQWPDRDGQRSSLAVAKLGAIKKAVGFNLTKGPDGGIMAGVFVGQQVDVLLGIDDKGYNFVSKIAKAGDKTGGAPKAPAAAGE